MTYQISFYLQIAASLSSILFLVKGKSKLLNFIPFIFLSSSYIFKPHLVKDNLQLITSFNTGLTTTDLKYFLINFLLKLFGSNIWIFIIFQITAAIIVINLFFISFPKELVKEKIRNFRIYTTNSHLIFIAFNYLIIGLTKLSVYHPRQFLSTLICIYCLYQISILQKNSQNIKLKTLFLSIIATFIHLIGVVTVFYILFLYLKNNNYFSLERIKIISFKNTLFQKYINIFMIIFILILLYFTITNVYTFILSYAKNFVGLGAYIRELGYGEPNVIGFLLPIITLIPLINYTSIIPFNNFLKSARNDEISKRYLHSLNLYSLLAFCIIFLEKGSSFYSIGRLKTILLPFLFYLIFKIPKQSSSRFARISSLILIYFLSIFSVYRVYSNIL